MAVASYASCSRGHGQICIRFLFARSDIANGGECRSICRSTDRSLAYITIQASFFRRFYLLPFARPPSTDPSREILDNFFFSLRFDTLVMVIFRWKWKERGIEKRSGKFLVELMRRRDTKNHANES